MADEVENEEIEETEDEEFPDDEVELLDDDEDDPLVEDDDALIVDDDSLVSDDDEDDVELPVVDLAEKGKDGKARPAAAVEPDEEDDDDEDDADVEASLDVILKERLVVEDDEADDDDEKGHVAEHDHGDTNRKVPPRRPDEFVCQSCFLVKHPSQLADKSAQLCLDCV